MAQNPNGILAQAILQLVYERISWVCHKNNLYYYISFKSVSFL